LERLSDLTRTNIDERLVVLRQQPDAIQIRDMVDLAIVEAGSKDEHVSAIKKVIRLKWMEERDLPNTFKFTMFSIKTINDRCWDWKHPNSRGVKRYVKQYTQNGETLVIDRYYASVDECAADINLSYFKWTITALTLTYHP